MAQDQSGAHRRLRDRRIHGAKGKSRASGRAAARRHGRRDARATRAASAPGSTTRCSASSRQCSTRSFARDAPCAPPIGAGATAIPETKTTTWVEPLYVCEVRFREWTPDGVLRHADVPADAARQGSARLRAPGHAAPSRRARAARESPARPADACRAARRRRRDAPRSRRPSLLEPQEGLLARRAATRRAISSTTTARSAPWMSPYLSNRPLVLTRFPDGIDGKSFYQKDAPEFAPAWIRTVPIWSEDTQRDIKLLRLRRRRVAALRREHGLDPDAHLEQPRGIARAARLVRDRSRSEGSAVLRRRSARRSCCASSARRSDCRAT